MAYLTLNGTDFSMYVNELKVTNNHYYNAQINAAGNTVVDYINKKRTIEVGIIPVNDTVMANLQAVINGFNVKVAFRNPQTNVLEENVNCIIPSNDVSYYTIQSNKVMYQALKLKFQEL